jgi:hypothetical protein
MAFIRATENLASRLDTLGARRLALYCRSTSPESAVSDAACDLIAHALGNFIARARPLGVRRSFA